MNFPTDLGACTFFSQQLWSLQTLPGSSVSPCLYSQIWNKLLWCSFYRQEDNFCFTKKMKSPFLWGATCKWWGVTSTSYSLGDSKQTSEDFSQWEQISHWKNLLRERWIPQHRAHLSFSWAGCLATLSVLCFWEEKLDQMLIEFPPNLVFYDSVILWFSYSGRSLRPHSLSFLPSFLPGHGIAWNSRFYLDPGLCF